jgi:4-hydroxy-4-methyl-2-oxoglutarate aldolase
LFDKLTDIFVWISYNLMILKSAMEKIIMDYASLFQADYSTAMLADAAFRAGILVRIPPSGLVPLDRQQKLAGPVFTVEANNDLVSILVAVHRAEAGQVAVITNKTYEVAVFGDLIATEARRKGLAGFVVDGLVRDTIAVLDIGLPVISRGKLPIGPLKIAADLKGMGQINGEVHMGDIAIQPGDWIFGDADGVIILTADNLEGVFTQADTSQEREDQLMAEIRAGAALGDLLKLEDFMEKRAKDPSASFKQHRADLGRAQ